MRGIFHKLRRSNGVSMLMALLFFLVCLVLGSLIMTAATANASKAQARYEDQQNYLAASSAARLLKEQLGTYTYTAGAILEDSGWTDITPYISPADGRGGDLLTDAYAATQGETAYTKEFDISAGEDLPSVRAAFEMKAGGDAVIVLTCGDYEIRVSFDARTARVTDYISYDYLITSWDEGTIEKEAS